MFALSLFRSSTNFLGCSLFVHFFSLFFEWFSMTRRKHTWEWAKKWGKEFRTEEKTTTTICEIEAISVVTQANRSFYHRDMWWQIYPFIIIIFIIPLITISRKMSVCVCTSILNTLNALSHLDVATHFFQVSYFFALFLFRWTLLLCFVCLMCHHINDFWFREVSTSYCWGCCILQFKLAGATAMAMSRLFHK